MIRPVIPNGSTQSLLLWLVLHTQWKETGVWAGQGLGPGREPSMRSGSGYRSQTTSSMLLSRAQHVSRKAYGLSTWNLICLSSARAELFGKLHFTYVTQVFNAISGSR